MVKALFSSFQALHGGHNYCFSEDLMRTGEEKRRKKSLRFFIGKLFT